MQHAAVSLPDLHLASKVDGAELIVRGSLTLKLPVALGRPQTSAELLGLVTSNQVWIRRAGPCHLYVSVTVDGHALMTPGHMARIVQWVEGCEVWDRLGCRIQTCADSNSDSEKAFSIQHPDMSSSLIAPAGAPTADFASWSCSLELITKEATPPDAKRAPKKRKLMRHEADSGGPRMDSLFSQYLTATDHKAVEDFVRSINLRSESAETRGGPKRKSQDCKPVSELLDSTSVRDLVQTALRTTIMGRRGQVKGVSWIGETPSHSLVDLAPAVFHMPYLKEISDRARLLPVIATSLAKLVNAESPTLRQKVESLGTLPNSDSGQDEVQGVDANSLVSGIERRTWGVLVTTLEPQHLNKRASARKGGPTAPVPTTEHAPKPGVGGGSLEDDATVQPTMVTYFEEGEDVVMSLSEPSTVYSSPRTSTPYREFSPYRLGSSGSEGGFLATPSTVLAPFVEPSIYSAPSNSHPQSQSYTQWPTSSQVWERREGDFATSRGRWDQSQMSHPGSYINLNQFSHYG